MIYLRKITVAVALILSVAAAAQENDTSADENVEVKKKEKKYRAGEIRTLARNGHAGGYGAIGLKTGEFVNETVVMATIRGGWIINRTIAMGFDFNGIIPTAQYANISLNGDAILLGGYGGMFIEPIVFSNQVVHVTFPISGGAGWLGYSEDWENNVNDEEVLIDEDVFWYVEPGVALELNVAKGFRINAGVTKRFTQDLELLNTSNSGFNGLNYFVTFKFGRF